MPSTRAVGNLNPEFAKPEEHPSLNPGPQCSDTVQGRKERLVQDTLDQEQDNRQELRPEDKQEHKKDEKGCLQKRGPPTPTPKYAYLVCSNQRLHSKVIFNKLFSFTRCLGQAMALKKRCLSFQLIW